MKTDWEYLALWWLLVVFVNLRSNNAPNWIQSKRNFVAHWKSYRYVCLSNLYLNLVFQNIRCYGRTTKTAAAARKVRPVRPHPPAWTLHLNITTITITVDRSTRAPLTWLTSASATPSASGGWRAPGAAMTSPNQPGNYPFIFNRISTNYTSIDSSFNALSNIFWVQLDPTNGLVTNSQNLPAANRGRHVISQFLRFCGQTLRLTFLDPQWNFQSN